MSIYRARLRNTSNAPTLRMSGEQIRLQVRSKLFGVNSWIAHNDQAVNSTGGPASENERVTKVLDGELEELTADDFWQIADAGDQELRRLAHSTVIDEVPWSSVPKTTMDCHSKLVLHSLRNNQPVQIIVLQP